MNVAYQGPWPKLSDADGLLMDVARRIQLTKTKHEVAVRNFQALCQHVDRDESPLHNLVVECYPSGSFATGTAIASRVQANQHDVDVVIELGISPASRPQDVLDALYEATNGEQGSRYYGKVEKKSRCVTVNYEDGTTVDLMPVARLAEGPPRVGNLFHHKHEIGEAYHKPVNPWGFADHFNRLVEYDPAFHELFKGRRLLVEGELSVKAETQPMPDHETLEEKSPRVVALQLIKRMRDVAFRQQSCEGFRKPPSVALSAMSLDAGQVQPSLVDEVIHLATFFRTRLREKNGPRGTMRVFNPTYSADEFTDRWPENGDRQDLFDYDLRQLIEGLRRLKNDILSFDEKNRLLSRLFGETAAAYAIESHLDARRREMEASCLRVGPTGKVGAAAVASVVGTSRTTAARPATREGGGHLPE